ncbi:hypothetical protein NEFER03_2152 [Nematocida sp. LUAm3]|nr:hypothetical protein NEFER03_2152 [Nematocida sp. LUAm3]
MHLKPKNAKEKKERDKIPGYLKWRHLLPSVGDARIPSSLSFLLRVITLTDSVILFNSSKRLTNTLSSVIRTVKHLAKKDIAHTHYRQIKEIFGDIYIYSESCIKSNSDLIIEIEEIEDRAAYCHEKAVSWTQNRYCIENSISLDEDPKKIQIVNQLLLEDENFHSSSLPEAHALLPTLPTFVTQPISTSEENKTPSHITLSIPAHIAPSIPNTSQNNKEPSSPSGTQRGLSILERIREKERKRKEEFINLEIEKDKEIEKAFHSIYMLCLTENKKSFEKSFLSKKLPIFAKGTITIDNVITHRKFQTFIKQKQYNSQTFLIFELEEYRKNNLIE